MSDSRPQCSSTDQSCADELSSSIAADLDCAAVQRAVREQQQNDGGPLQLLAMRALGVQQHIRRCAEHARASLTEHAARLVVWGQQQASQATQLAQPWQLVQQHRSSCATALHAGRAQPFWSPVLAVSSLWWWGSPAPHAGGTPGQG
jgi:hypothetical protein